MYRLVGIIAVWAFKRKLRSLPTKSQKKILRQFKRNHKNLPWK